MAPVLPLRSTGCHWIALMLQSFPLFCSLLVSQFTQVNNTQQQYVCTLEKYVISTFIASFHWSIVPFLFVSIIKRNAYREKTAKGKTRTNYSLHWIFFSLQCTNTPICTSRLYNSTYLVCYTQCFYSWTQTNYWLQQESKISAALDISLQALFLFFENSQRRAHIIINHMQLMSDCKN